MTTPDIQPYVTAYHRLAQGLPAGKDYADYVDYMTAFTNDATLVSAARDEANRLTPILAARPEDYITKLTLKALTEMLAAFDGGP